MDESKRVGDMDSRNSTTDTFGNSRQWMEQQFRNLKLTILRRQRIASAIRVVAILAAIVLIFWLLDNLEVFLSS